MKNTKDLSEKLQHDSFVKELEKLLPTKILSDTEIENALVQPNNISKAVYNCNVSTQRLFSYLIKIFKTEKRTSKTRTFEFTPAQVKNDLKFTNVNQIKKALQDLKELSILIETEHIYEGYSLIDYFKYDKDNNSILIELGTRFSKLLEKKLTGNFTTLDFDSIVELTNFYSIRFYEIAMSWRGIKGRYHKPNSDWYNENIKDYKNSWFFGYSIENLRLILDIQDKYKDTKDFLEKVIYKPIEILNEKLTDYSFFVEIIRESRERISKKTGKSVDFGKVKGIIFWIIEKKQTFIEYLSTDSYQVIEEKRELNEDAQEYDKAMAFKEAHLEEWQKQESISKEKLNKIYGATTMQILIDMDVYKELKDKI